MLRVTLMSSFETTHWSLVRAAGSDSTGRARDALAQLCGTYWEPLYAYLRRQGHSAEDAEDLTQGFFARVLEKGVLDAAEQRYLAEPADRETPERLFDRRWSPL